MARLAEAVRLGREARASGSRDTGAASSALRRVAIVPLMPASTRDWEHWGRFDPLYGVASISGRERGGTNPWTEADFYATGATEWAEMAPTWSRYAGSLAGTVVEIGCGAGRLSRQLAATFPKLVGLDVSPDQLELARAAVAQTPAATEFRLATGARLPCANGEADAIFSTHVFQHLPPKLVESLLIDCGRVLAPGGTLMLHIPIPGTNLAGTQLADIVRRLKRAAPVRAAALRVGHRLGRTVPPMAFRLLDPAWVFARLERGGLRDAELHAFEVGGMRLAFFLARRPAPGVARVMAASPCATGRRLRAAGSEAPG
jgi:SAM-dependent methyltransferase